jgi:hypothetical protein
VFGLLAAGDIWSKKIILTQMTPPLLEYNDEISKLNSLNSEIKIITDAQDFVHEFMDSL